jgi:hypothetical protein
MCGCDASAECDQHPNVWGQRGAPAPRAPVPDKGVVPWKMRDAGIDASLGQIPWQISQFSFGSASRRSLIRIHAGGRRIENARRRCFHYSKRGVSVAGASTELLRLSGVRRERYVRPFIVIFNVTHQSRPSSEGCEAAY